MWLCGNDNVCTSHYIIIVITVDIDIVHSLLSCLVRLFVRVSVQECVGKKTIKMIADYRIDLSIASSNLVCRTHAHTTNLF